jgi:hypothetical protein
MRLATRRGRFIAAHDRLCTDRFLRTQVEHARAIARGIARHVTGTEVQHAGAIASRVSGRLSRQAVGRGLDARARAAGGICRGGHCIGRIGRRPGRGIDRTEAVASVPAAADSTWAPAFEAVSLTRSAARVPSSRVRPSASVPPRIEPFSVPPAVAPTLPRPPVTEPPRPPFAPPPSSWAFAVPLVASTAATAALIRTVRIFMVLLL